MHEINAKGGCLCGAIRFHLQGPVMGAGACHCRDCQYISGGAPAYVIIVPKSALHMEKGTPAVFENVAESGVRRYRQFCATCGTPLFAENSKFPTALSIKVGSLDDTSLFTPQAHFWTSSAARWHSFVPGLPQYARGPTQAARAPSS